VQLLDKFKGCPVKVRVASTKPAPDKFIVVSWRPSRPAFFGTDRARYCSSAQLNLQKESELIQPIKARNLVGFCERGIVEDSVAEIVHRAAQGKNGLPDVHNFGGAFTDHVDAEDLSRVRVKENFQHSSVVANDLGLGQFLVLGDSDFKGNV